jgi:dihydrofolate reductase
MLYDLISIVTEEGNVIENIPDDFYIPEDLKRFYELTNNNIVVMGRKTFDTLKKPLKNRINIVITKNTNYQNSNNLFYCKLEDLDNILNKLENLDNILNKLEDLDNILNKLENFDNILNKLDIINKKIFIIGGYEIYNTLINKCNKLYLTIVYSKINGKKLLSFDKINKEYQIIDQSEIFYSTNTKCNYNYITYQKI